MTLEARDVCVSFGRTQVLNDAEITANSGALTAIVGPNGSGKTTFLRAMTGDLSSTGSVILNGRDAKSLPAVELAKIRAVLPQSGSIAFPFTVLELVRLGLTAGLSSKRISQLEHLPQFALERVGLSGFEGRFVQELSGGERQRAQLARVLVQIWEPVIDGQPRWLFLDEPVSALDIGHQLLIMQLAREYAEAGGGVVAVMHDLNLTAMFSDHVVLMNNGRVHASGAPAEVLTDLNLSVCYECDLRTNTAPPLGGPWILPQAALKGTHG